MTRGSRRGWLGLIFGLEIINGLFHHGWQRAEGSDGVGPVDMLATLFLVILLCAAGAAGAWPARRLPVGAVWAAAFWCYAMLTSFLIVLTFQAGGSAALEAQRAVIAALMLTPVAALMGCVGVLISRRSR